MYELCKKNNSYPVDTLYCLNVYKTSMRRRQHRKNVLQTLKQRLLSWVQVIQERDNNL